MLVPGLPEHAPSGSCSFFAVKSYLPAAAIRFYYTLLYETSFTISYYTIAYYIYYTILPTDRQSARLPAAKTPNRTLRPSRPNVNPQTETPI